MILGFFGVEVPGAAPPPPPLPLGIEAGFDSGIARAMCAGFASCDCRDDEEIEGEGVGCTGRAVGTSRCPFMVGKGMLEGREARAGHWTSVLPHPPRKANSSADGRKSSVIDVKIGMRRNEDFISLCDMICKRSSAG